MNDSELEANLRQMLPPVRPSAGLHTRIWHEVRPPASQPPTRADEPPAWISPSLLRFLRNFGWACAGATAALLAFSYLPLKQASVKSRPIVSASVANTSTSASADQPDAFEHAESTNELVATEDSDEVIETSNGPAREVRYSYLERHSWSNPRTGALVVLEVPREDVYLMPVALQ